MKSKDKGGVLTCFGVSIFLNILPEIITSASQTSAAVRKLHITCVGLATVALQTTVPHMWMRRQAMLDNGSLETKEQSLEESTSVHHSLHWENSTSSTEFGNIPRMKVSLCGLSLGLPQLGMAYPVFSEKILLDSSQCSAADTDLSVFSIHAEELQT